LEAPVSEFLGFKVRVRFSTEPAWGEYRNVTRIDYLPPPCHCYIGLESKVHSIGVGLPLREVVEFEATPETEKAEAF
jgi:hypothetical protein